MGVVLCTHSKLHESIVRRMKVIIGKSAGSFSGGFGFFAKDTQLKPGGSPLRVATGSRGAADTHSSLVLAWCPIRLKRGELGHCCAGLVGFVMQLNYNRPKDIYPCQQMRWCRRGLIPL
jgi:hypothetical protein